MKTYIVVNKFGQPIQVVSYHALRLMSTVCCFSLALSALIFTEVKKLTREEQIVDG